MSPGDLKIKINAANVHAVQSRILNSDKAWHLYEGRGRTHDRLAFTEGKYKLIKHSTTTK